jgi:tRNA (guanine-N7-)-methyltransferase
VRAGRITEAQQRALDDLWPRYGVEFDAKPLDLTALFGREAPRVVEIGFGNGENLAALATAHPERDYLGIEVHRAGVGRLMLAAQVGQLTNVRIACHDAVEVLEHQIVPGALDEILILFPDPWHKKRHHKRRLIQPPFIELAVSRLKRGGLLRLATDWEPYAVQMLEVLSANPSLENAASGNGYSEKPADRITTRFEKRGQRLGHGVWDLTFARSS